MTKRTAVVMMVVVVSCAALGAATINEVRLADGRDDVNTLASAVFDGSRVQPLRIGSVQSAYNRGSKIVRRGATGFFTRGPEYDLAKSVDLGLLVSEALKSEALTMGLRTATDQDGAWQVGGTLNEMYLESKQIPYGATLFYGYMDTTFEVSAPDGARETRRMRFHNYYGGYNAGFGRRDEAREALAHLLVEGSQEAIGRLNRDLFKAPAHARIAGIARRLRESPAGVRPNDMFAAGLSGSGEAAAALLARLPNEQDENLRSSIIDALAKTGSPDAVAPLASRYQTEDEDCRWYTLKAMHYIGGAAALGLVRTQGMKDGDGGPRRLAQRITTGS